MAETTRRSALLGGLAIGVGALLTTSGTASAGSAFQDGRRHCVKCQGLAYNSPAGVCPLDGRRHSTQGSYDYWIYCGPGQPASQGDWHHCVRCQGLHYQRTTDAYPGWCPAVGRHSVAGSFDYRLRLR